MNIHIADSLLRQKFLDGSSLIPTEKYIELLDMYQNDFSSNRICKPFALEEKAIAYLRIGPLDSAIANGQKANESYNLIGEEEGVARTEMIMAAAKSFKGDFGAAMKHQYKAIEIYKQLNDSVGIYNALTELSINCFNEKRYSDAAQISEEVLSYAERQKDTFLIAEILITLGSTYHQLKNDRKAKESIIRSIDLRAQLNDDFGLSQAYGGMAMVNMSEGKWEEAISWCYKSINISEEIEDYRNLTTMYYNLGTSYFEIKDLNKAEDAYQSVLKYTKKTGIKDVALLRTYERLAAIKQKQNNQTERADLLKKLLEIKDDLFSEDKLRISEELQAKYSLSEKQQKLELVELENKRNSEKRLILTIALALVLFFAIVLVFTLIQTNRNRNKLFEAEQKLKDEEVKRIQRELSYNREQLNDFTHHLVEKNKVIFELENKLISKVKTEERSQYKLNNENEEVSSLLQLRILTEDDWSKFKIYFDKVFPGMILDLRQEHIDLTGAEERLFLLMKLKSDSREMSEILGISMESVRKNKYRLKKKLKLNEDMTLEDYVNAFK
ncbi:MAG: tetratricopeptide repeat protein [Bacteroidia bacterium]